MSAVTTSEPNLSLNHLRQRAEPTALVTREGRVAFLNAAARAALGRLPADRGLDWWDLWHPDERARLADALREAAAGRTVRLDVATAPDRPSWDLILLPIEDAPCAEGAPLLVAIARAPARAA